MALLPAINRKSGPSTGSSFLSYPSELGVLERDSHYVIFYINQQAKSQVKFGEGAYNSNVDTNNEATTLTIKRAPTKRLSQAIALYMPAQLEVAHTANYGEQEMGAAVAMAMSALQDSGEGISMDAIAKQITASGADMINDMATKALDATIATGAVAARDIRAGKIRNNRSEMAFEGIGRRDFNFSFSLLPKNAREANDIEQIVTAFRYHAMPEIDGSDATGRTMIAPSTFDIQYKPDAHLHKISTSVLTGVSVKYGGERVQFFRDGHPVQTELTLSFKELEIITKERIAAGF